MRDLTRRLLLSLTIMLAAAAYMTGAKAQPGYAVGIAPSIREGTAPLTVSFRLTIFTQGGGQVRSARLDFGDGSPPIAVRTAAPQPISHTYTSTGQFRPRLIVVTGEGEELDSVATVQVRPRSTPDPGALMRADPGTGLTPLEVTFTFALESLPFTPRIISLDPGDGSEPQFVNGQEVALHTYRDAGAYQASLLVRGDYENIARGSATVIAEDEPSLGLDVRPARGPAPLSVEIVPTVPEGQAISALTLGVDGATSPLPLGDGSQPLAHVLESPGTYTFTLSATTPGGTETSTEAQVEVVGQDITGLYLHRGGIAAIGGGDGEFTGLLQVATPDLLALGYAQGTHIVDGVYVERARADEIPDSPAPDPEDPETGTEAPPPDDGTGLPGGLIYLPGTEQVAQGRYLVLQGKDCPEQWGDYAFTIDYGDPASGRRPLITGTVTYRDAMKRYERAYQRLDMDVPAFGIVGHVRRVRILIEAVTAAGDSGEPEDCVLADSADAVMVATFEGISEEQANERVEEIQEEIEEALRRLVEMAAGDTDIGDDGDEDGTRRGLDRTHGLTMASDEPVLLHNGEYLLTRTDLAVPGRGLAWSFERTYRSQTGHDTSLGVGWVHNAMNALVRDGDSWRFRTGDSGAIRLTPLQEGLFGGPGGHRLLVTGNERVVRNADGTFYRFIPLPGDPDRSRIVTVEDGAGNRLSYETDFMGRVLSVTDPLGLVAHYRYHPQSGLLEEVEAPDGRRMVFEHDRGGRLVRAAIHGADEDIPARLERYAYADSTDPALFGNMTYLWLPRDTDSGPSVEIDYGTDPEAETFDRVVRQRDGSAEEHFAYARIDSDGMALFQTTLSAAGRADRVFQFDRTGSPVQKSYILPNGDAVTLSRIFDEAGRLIFEVMPGGNGRRIVRDEHGLPVEIRHIAAPGSGESDRVYLLEYEPLFRELRAVYGPFAGDPPSDPAQRAAALAARYTYDYQEAAELPPRLAAMWPGFSPPGLGDVNGDGRTDQALGRLVRVELPAADEARGAAWTETIRQYDDQGQLILERAPGVPTLAVSYRQAPDGGSGRIASMNEQRDTGPRVLAEMEWDEAGRLIGMVDAHGGRVGFVYDSLNRIARQIPDDPDRAAIAYAYDIEGNEVGQWALTREDLRLGRQGLQLMQRTFGRYGLLLEEQRRVDDATIITRDITYDAYGRLAEFREEGQHFMIERDGLGRMVRGVAMLDGEPLYAVGFNYDANGNLVRHLAANGDVTEYGYDGHDRLVRITGPDGRILVRELDLLGRPVAQRLYASAATEEAGPPVYAEGMLYAPGGRIAEQWVEDAFGRRTSETIALTAAGEPLGYAVADTEIAYDYSADGVPTGMSDDAGYSMRFGYDQAARLTETTAVDADGAPVIVEHVEFDSWGRRIRAEQRDFGQRTYAYDWLNRADVIVTSAAMPDGEFAPVSRESADYDDQLRITSLVEQGWDGSSWRDLLTIEASYGAFVMPESVRVDGTEVARFAYDAYGNLVARRWHDGPQHTFSHDYATGGVAMTDGRGVPHRAYESQSGGPEGGALVYVAHGGTLTDLADVQDVFAYDAARRLRWHDRDGWRFSQEAGPDGIRRTFSDEAGGLSVEASESWSQDSLHRTLPSGLVVNIERSPEGTETINVSGQVLTVTYPEGSLERRLRWGVLETSIALASDLMRQAVEVTALASNDGDPVLEVSWRFGDEALVNEVVASDGHRLVVRRDVLGRIDGGEVSAPAAAQRSLSFSYDTHGNRTSWRDGPIGAVAAHDGYLCRTIMELDCTHDGDHRLTGLGARDYGYDSAGALVSVRDDTGLVVDYRRDALGQVVVRSDGSNERIYLQDGVGVVAEYLDGALAIEYVRDSRDQLIGVVDHRDEAGPEILIALSGPDRSLLALIGADGAVRERYVYGPFGETRVFGPEGETRSAPMVSVLWHGMLYDAATGLYLAPARTYVPALGRFLEPEPLGPDAAPHPYAYGFDDPLSFTDPLGADPRSLDINEILRDGANDPQNANWLVRFGLWLKGLWDTSNEAMGWVNREIAGENPPGSDFSQYGARIEAALPTKNQVSAEELHGRLANYLTTQMAMETFGPAVIGGAFEILGRGAPLILNRAGGAARASRDTIRRVVNRLRGQADEVAGVSDWAQQWARQARLRQFHEAAEFRRAASLSPFEPIAWQEPLRREIDYIVDDAMRAAGVSDLGRYVDEVQWVRNTNSPYFETRLAIGADGRVAVHRTLALPDNYGTMRIALSDGSSLDLSNEFAARAFRMHAAGHEFAHAEEFEALLRRVGDPAEAIRQQHDMIRVRGVRYANEEVRVDTRSMDRLLDYLGPERVRQLSPELIDEHQRYVDFWRDRTVRAAYQGRI